MRRFPVESKSEEGSINNGMSVLSNEVKPVKEKPLQAALSTCGMIAHRDACGLSGLMEQKQILYVVRKKIQIRILDYKPEARMVQPIEQLPIYALALSRKLNLPMYYFKCLAYEARVACE